MSYHFSLEVVDIDEDGFKMGNSGWTADLTEDIGEFMLEKSGRVGETCRGTEK